MLDSSRRFWSHHCASLVLRLPTSTLFPLSLSLHFPIYKMVCLGPHSLVPSHHYRTTSITPTGASTVPESLKLARYSAPSAPVSRGWLLCSFRSQLGFSPKRGTPNPAHSSLHPDCAICCGLNGGPQKG